MAKKIDVYGELNSRTGEGKLADASQIWDSTQGKFQDEINQETANDGLVSVKVEQEFTDEEKAQGRENIGAASQEDIDDKIEEIEEDLQDYARKDGSYEQMIAGGAMNLAGQTVEVNSEMYHPTGVNHASGVAEVRGIKGNTVVWNQLIQNGKFETTNTWRAMYAQNIEFTANNNKLVISDLLYSGSSSDPIAVVTTYRITGNNHVFLILFDFGIILGTGISGPLVEAGGYHNVINIAGTKYASLFTFQSSTASDFDVLLKVGGTKSDGDSWWFSNVQLFDLTLIYGAGNEPSTPEQFEADYFKWFGKPLTYEEYDEGSLRSVNMAAYKTTGFNQWDEEWEYAYYPNGVKTVSTQSIGGVNLIKVYSGKTYYFRGGSQLFICYYNSDAQYIQNHPEYNDGGRVRILTGRFLTIPSGVRFIRFSVYNPSEKPYQHNYCINISNAERNGEYEPYEVHNYPMPVTTMKGKLNGEGASVVVFPDGMKSAGTIHDEIFISGGKTYGIKRVGAVDLGSLTWTKKNSSAFSGGYFFVAYVPNIATHTDVNDCVNSKYIYTFTGAPSEKTFGRYGNDVRIYDTSYSDAATFKAAMNGVMLYYELATPEIYEIDDFTLPQNVLVDSDGTEEVINAQGKENDSVAPYIDMIYSINAVGALNNLPQGYISEKSMDNFLARLSSAMGGTWTKSWNSTLKEYEFTFTPSANTNSLTQNNEEA